MSKRLSKRECEAIEQDCVEKVRKALKLITSCEIYDGRGYLNKAGYEALEELEGLDLFWVCDPRIKLVKEKSEPKECEGCKTPLCDGCKNERLRP